MKKSMLKIAGIGAFMLSSVLLFTQCNSDMNGMEPEDFKGGINMGNGRGNGFRGGQNNAGPNQQGGQGASTEEVCNCLTANFPSEALSAKETSNLLFMREEEKLARDVYQGLFEKWGSPVFDNIANAEQRHMEAIGCLLKKYSLVDPVGENPVGVFGNAALKDLYTRLFEEGSTSLTAAYQVGATIEDLDISDLLKATEEADNQDVKAVFAELTKGSRNHLRAFAKNLGTLNATYTVQYLDKELYDSILEADQERGGSICGTCPNSQNGGNARQGGDCNGMGTGTGQGNNGRGRGRN